MLEGEDAFAFRLDTAILGDEPSATWRSELCSYTPLCSSDRADSVQSWVERTDTFT